MTIYCAERVWWDVFITPAFLADNPGRLDEILLDHVLPSIAETASTTIDQVEVRIRQAKGSLDLWAIPFRVYGTARWATEASYLRWLLLRLRDAELGGCWCRAGDDAQSHTGLCADIQAAFELQESTNP